MLMIDDDDDNNNVMMKEKRKKQSLFLRVAKPLVSVHFPQSRLRSSTSRPGRIPWRSTGKEKRHHWYFSGYQRYQAVHCYEPSVAARFATKRLQYVLKFTPSLEKLPQLFYNWIFTITFGCMDPVLFLSTLCITFKCYVYVNIHLFLDDITHGNIFLNSCSKTCVILMKIL